MGRPPAGFKRAGGCAASPKADVFARSIHGLMRAGPRRGSLFEQRDRQNGDDKHDAE
jgi:hypothetical protein